MSKKKHEKGVGYVPNWYVKPPSKQLQDIFINDLPSGSIIQIQSSGEGTFKTSVALQIASNVQDLGYPIAYVDAENALFNALNSEGEEANQWLENLGVDLAETYIINSGPMEDLYDEVNDLIKNYGVKCVILDSIHAMQPGKIHEQEAGSSVMGLQAKIHGLELVKLTRVLREHDAMLIGINHKKAVITDRGSFGEKAVGGKGWGFYSQAILVNSRTTSKSTLEDANIVDLKVYVEKNKFGGPQFREVRLKAEQGYGIVDEPDMIAEMLDLGVMQKSGGAWYRINDEAVAQGDENLIMYVRENKEELKKLIEDAKKNN